MRRHRRGFTLIEVLAALALIIVLTGTLVITIQGQVAQANRRQLDAMVKTVNAQIAIAWSQEDRDDAQFANAAALVQAGIISQDQREQLAKTAYAPHEFRVP